MNGIEVVYLTHEGHEKLQAELKHLVEVRRREVAEMIRDAKADGDLRENAAYDEAKEQQGFVEGRIQELEDMLRRAKVIEEPTTKSISLGSLVMVVEADDDGTEEEFRIVGSAEADPLRGKISNLSPLGAALMGRKAGDVVKYSAPNGSVMSFKILDVR